MVTSSEDESDGDADPTPLVHRLRSRASRGSLAREPTSDRDADGEEESEADGQNRASPRPRRRESRTKPKSDVSETSPRQSSLQQSEKGGKALPDRGAKRKAIEALKGGESDTEDDDAKMEDGDEEMVTAEHDDAEEPGSEDEDAPRSGPTTRSQYRAQGGTASQRSVVMESDDEEDVPERERNSYSSLSPTPGPDRMDVEETPAPEHRTRSGKAFGRWQRRRNRLRQEAIDDPDMEALEEEIEEEEVDEGEDEEEDFETGKLAFATDAGV